MDSVNTDVIVAKENQSAFQCNITSKLENTKKISIAE